MSMFTKSIADCETVVECETTVNELLSEGESLNYDRTVRNRSRKLKKVNAQLSMAAAKCARMQHSDISNVKKWSRLGTFIESQVTLMNKIKDQVRDNIEWL